MPASPPPDPSATPLQATQRTSYAAVLLVICSGEHCKYLQTPCQMRHDVASTQPQTTPVPLCSVPPCPAATSAARFDTQVPEVSFVMHPAVGPRRPSRAAAQSGRGPPCSSPASPGPPARRCMGSGFRVLLPGHVTQTCSAQTCHVDIRRLSHRCTTTNHLFRARVPGSTWIMLYLVEGKYACHSVRRWHSVGSSGRIVCNDSAYSGLISG